MLWQLWWTVCCLAVPLIVNHWTIIYFISKRKVIFNAWWLLHTWTLLYSRNVIKTWDSTEIVSALKFIVKTIFRIFDDSWNNYFPHIQACKGWITILTKSKPKFQSEEVLCVYCCGHSGFDIQTVSQTWCGWTTDQYKDLMHAECIFRVFSDCLLFVFALRVLFDPKGCADWPQSAQNTTTMHFSANIWWMSSLCLSELFVFWVCVVFIIWYWSDSWQPQTVVERLWHNSAIVVPKSQTEKSCWKWVSPNWIMMIFLC